LSRQVSIAALPDSILSRAAEWAARLRSPDATPAERASFEEWLAADPAHREAYARCERVSAWPGRLRADPGLVAELRAAAAPGTAPVAAQRRFNRWQLALAASGAVVTIALLMSVPRLSNDAVEVATHRGEQRTLALADGSIIQLNTHSVLTYRLTPTERRVELRDGEAFFNVAKDPARPFVVKAGKAEVRVVGTQFTVRQVAGELEVVVKEGKVDVVPEPRFLGPNAPRRVELTPGSRLQLEPSGQDIKVAAVDVDRALAWRSGVATFDAAPLEEVVAAVNRYAEAPLAIEDESLRAVRVSGQFRIGDVEGVRFMLRESFGIESTPRAGVIGLRSATARASDSR